MMSGSLAILEVRSLHGLNPVGWFLFVCLFVFYFLLFFIFCCFCSRLKMLHHQSSLTACLLHLTKEVKPRLRTIMYCRGIKVSLLYRDISDG